MALVHTLADWYYIKEEMMSRRLIVCAVLLVIAMCAGVMIYRALLEQDTIKTRIVTGGTSNAEYILSQMFPHGVRVAAVLGKLDAEGIEHSGLLKNTTVQAIVRGRSTFGLRAQRNISITFSFDISGQLTDIEVKEVYTGV